MRGHTHMDEDDIINKKNEQQLTTYHDVDLDVRVGVTEGSDGEPHLGLARRTISEANDPKPIKMQDSNWLHKNKNNDVD